MWHFLLHRIFGISPEAADQGKLGGGVVAFTAWVTIAFFAAVGGISWALSENPYFALGIVAITAAVVAYFLKGTWTFADKHPVEAALGGAWFLKYREIELAAKGQPALPQLPSEPDPAQALPSSEPLLLDAPDED